MLTSHRTTATALLAAASLFGCTADSDPLSPAAALRPSSYESEIKDPLTTVSSADIALLGFEVRGPEFETPLRYQIPLTEGVSYMPLSLPTGKDYELDVRGYDRYGEQTFEGRSRLEYVGVGANEPLAVELSPVGKGEWAEARFDVVGEEPAPEGLRLVITADRKEIGEGQSLNLRAYGLDAEGRHIDLDPARLHWSIDDPRGGRFEIDPLNPAYPGPSCRSGTCEGWMTWHAAAHLNDARSRKLSVTVGNLIGAFEVVVAPNSFVDISAGTEVTCGVRRLGDLSCWGSNQYGMLGIGNTTAPDRCTPYNFVVECSVRPMAVSGGGLFSSVSVGELHVCALELTTGAAFCWGSNGYGQLGIPAATHPSRSPTAVSPPAGASTPLAFTSISVGGALTCAIATDGDEFCWGYGYGAEPVRGWHGWATRPGGPQAIATAVGSGFSCRMDRVTVWCDGAPYPGTPTYPWGPSFLGQATTARHVCAIASDATTWCWGHNASGQLGNGTTVDGRTQVDAPATLNTVATGMMHSCGLAGSVAYCWGSNYGGELGVDSWLGGSSRPLQVRIAYSTTPQWVRISTGAQHTCAIDTDGYAWCWGTNYSGQLGTGGKFDHNSNFPRQAVFAPVRTVGP